MILGANKRVVPRAGVSGFRGTGQYATANPGGPAGSALMMFAAIFQATKIPGVAAGTFEGVFGRTNAGNAGWGIYFTTTGILRFHSTNSTPSQVTSAYTFTAADLNKPIIALGVYNAGAMAGWVNSVATTPTTLGSGYTALSAATRIGNLVTGVDPARSLIVHDCVFIDAFNATATQAAIYAQWAEDLQQGRPLTPPHAATWDASSYYWSARDIQTGGVSLAATWTDRSANATAMTRTGAPQGALAMPRFA